MKNQKALIFVTFWGTVLTLWLVSSLLTESQPYGGGGGPYPTVTGVQVGAALSNITLSAGNNLVIGNGNSNIFGSFSGFNGNYPEVLTLATNAAIGTSVVVTATAVPSLSGTYYWSAGITNSYVVLTNVSGSVTGMLYAAPGLGKWVFGTNSQFDVGGNSNGLYEIETSGIATNTLGNLIVGLTGNTFFPTVPYGISNSVLVSQGANYIGNGGGAMWYLVGFGAAGNLGGDSGVGIGSGIGFGKTCITIGSQADAFANVSPLLPTIVIGNNASADSGGSIIIGPNSTEGATYGDTTESNSIVLARNRHPWEPNSILFGSAKQGTLLPTSSNLWCMFNGAIYASNAGGIYMNNPVILQTNAIYTITSVQSGAYFIDDGAPVVHTNKLPAAVVGLNFSWSQSTSKTNDIQCNGTDVIKYVTTATGAGGDIFSTNVGANVTLVCARAGVWTMVNVGPTNVWNIH